MNSQELTDRIALRELIDKISILGDRKDFVSQTQFFSENAISETYEQGKLLLKLEGRASMQTAFSEFLRGFEKVYHFNGQQTLEIDGDHASGNVYCLITLIAVHNGETIKKSIGATYQDEYVRENNRWLIAKRSGSFEWQNQSVSTKLT